MCVSEVFGEYAVVDGRLVNVSIHGICDVLRYILRCRSVRVISVQNTTVEEIDVIIGWTAIMNSFHYCTIVWIFFESVLSG
jgi:hypothetical protein